MKIEKLEDGKARVTITMPTKHYSFILEKEDIQQLRDIILGEPTVMVHPMTFKDIAVPEESSLLPCPFCGWTAQGSQTVSSFTIFCTNCSAYIVDPYTSNNDIVTRKWNARVK